MVVAGARSAAEQLTDSVFQGTVLGPVLCNIFYEDARRAANALGFTETVFADDLNCYRGFSVKNTNRETAVTTAELHVHALSKLQDVQKEIHAWGEASRVLFDPSKESLHVLHRRVGHGNSF